MDPFAKPTTAKQHTPVHNANPLAQALAEQERPLSDSQPQAGQSTNNDLFSEALARAGGQFANPNQDNSGQFPGLTPEQQQEKLLKEQQKKAERKRLHDQINPVDSYDVFSAREKQVLEKLEETRREIHKISIELSSMYHEIELAAREEIRSPGGDGAYYTSFLEKLRSFIMLLRQKVKSARSWTQQMNQKKAKQKKKKTPGMEMSGQNHEQSKTVFDTMHHERSNAYSGS